MEDLKKEQVKNTRFNHNGDLTEIKKEISEIIDNIGEDFPGTDFGSTDDEDEEYDVESLVEPFVDDLEGDKLSDESE